MHIMGPRAMRLYRLGAAIGPRDNTSSRADMRGQYYLCICQKD